jgi:hypothetical protein
MLARKQRTLVRREVLPGSLEPGMMFSMKEAIEDFAARLGPQHLLSGEVDNLKELTSGLNEWPTNSWPLGSEYEASTEMLSITSRALEELEHGSEDLESELLRRFQTPGRWVELFVVTELLTESRASANASVGLWNSRSIRLQRPGNLLFFALRAVAENHERNAFDVGWHLHPTEGNRHLGYRLFFDSSRTQDDLSWEQHGHRGGLNPYSWGDPRKEVLDEGDARDMHRACLAAVRKVRIAGKGQKFVDWASRFGKPSGKKAFVAHPPVKVPTPW